MHRRDLYPSRSLGRRPVSGLRPGEPAVLAGRLGLVEESPLGWQGKLTDESGAVRLCASGPPPLSGSLIEVKGALTPPGDVAVASWRTLAPCLRPPTPGLLGPERALWDPGLKARLRLRSQILAAIRGFFYNRGFVEVETPALVAAPGTDPALEPFTTTFVSLAGQKETLYLHTSPELTMKRLLVGGLERIFQICHVYRNGERLEGTHRPEFTMVEWYRAYASYLEIMDDLEELVHHLARVLGQDSLGRPQATVSLTSPFERATVAQAFERHGGIDLERCLSAPLLREAARGSGILVEDHDDFETLFCKIMVQEVEPHLGRDRPLLLRDYPACLAALAKLSEDNPRLAERFELYMDGVELANGFTELNDPQAQEARFQRDMEARRREGLILPPLDRAFLAALEMGMPPSGGVALGVDRLVALLLGADRIEDVMALPP